MKLKKVEDIRISQTHVAWVEKKSDPVERGYKSHIKIYNREAKKIKQFTTGSKRDYSPRFSPNGEKLAFISTRNEKPQLYIMDVQGGEGLKITKLKDGIDGLQWSPDSSKIAFIAKINPDLAEEEEEDLLTKFDKNMKKAKEKEDKRKKSDPMVVTKIKYRETTSYLDEEKFVHIFIYDMDSKDLKRISDGKFNYSAVSWISNDSVVCLTRQEEPIELNTEAMLIKLNISEQGTGTLLTKIQNPFFMTAPEAYPDGSVLVQKMGEGNFAGQITKWGLLAENGDTQIINDQLDRGIETVRWISKDNAVVSVNEAGRVDLRVYDKNSGEFSPLVRSPASIEFFDCLDTHEIFFIATDPIYPSAVWKWRSDKGFDLISDPNGEFLSQKQIIDPEEFWLENPEGLKYQGWFFDAGEKDGKKPPLVLSMHGGPHVMWNPAGTMWHEWQCFLSKGYSILAMNPIGSGGYGEKFSQAITEKWGVDDARDLLAGVDHFINRVDPERLYITGGSYAGFQTANIITRDHRFKAACAQRGVYDLLTFWSGTDIPLFAFWEWNRYYEKWSKEDLWYLWEHSPYGRAKEIQTPLMIIHSENDFRVAISQAEELFAALKIQDKEAVLVRYPRDGHELSRSGEPLHVIDRLERMIDWFDTHS
ncbi:MAG: S9 family peptidase [Candidatus Kariarchaeaceae archaeon]